MTEHGVFQAMLARRQELKAEEAAALQEHLDQCPECRVVEQEYAMQDDLLRAIPPPIPWFPMERRVLAQVHRRSALPKRRPWVAALLFAWRRSGLVLLPICGFLALTIALMANQPAHAPSGFARGAVPNRSTDQGRFGPAVDSAEKKLGVIQLQPTAADSAMLIAAPNEGHGGSAVYLSGAGFAPQSKLGLAVSCPGGDIASTSANRDAARYVVGTIVTNRNGSFAGRKIRVPVQQAARTSGCEIQASGNGGQRSQAPAIYMIVPTAVPTARCARTICISVTSKRSAGQSLLAVRAWPGADGRITVTGAGTAPIHQALHFDWQGLALMGMGQASSLRKRRVHVYITARLGDVSGTFAGYVGGL